MLGIHFLRQEFQWCNLKDFSGLMPVETLLVEEGEGGDHEGDGAGDDEDPADGAHTTCHLTHT